MSRRAFHLDLDLCTGCQACVIACANENEPRRPGAGALHWREVVVFNEAHRPGLPTYALSLACHHCGEPACVAACPSRAVRKETATGAVLVDETRCLGCRYCAWACPYAAPRYAAARGTVEKCTFCHHRLIEGLDPACVTACPTGALRLREHARAQGDAPPIAGLVSTRLDPAFGITPPRTPGPRVEPDPALPVGTALPPSAPVAVAGARAEWPLVIFTALVGLLAAVFAAAQIGSPAFRASAGPPVPPWAAPLFLLAGAAALAISLAHLGRPERAWRAARHARTSWLSREVVTVGAFVVAGALWLFAASQTAWSGPSGGHVALRALGWMIAALGFLGAFTVDRIYAVIVPVSGRASAARSGPIGPVLTGSVQIAGLLTAAAWLWAPASLGKAIYVLARLARDGDRRTRALVITRLLIGLALPAGLLVAYGAGIAPAAAILGFLGEVVERALFYGALHPSSPRLEMSARLAR